MTHTPQLVNFYSYQLRSAWPAALRDLVLRHIEERERGLDHLAMFIPRLSVFLTHG